jgi:hypothetical protein
LYLLPGLLALSNAAFGEQSRYIYQHIRSPHHYIPMNYLDDFVKFFGISLLGLASAVLHLTKKSPLKPLVLLFLSMLSIVTFATVLTTKVFVPFVSQLFPWHLGLAQKLIDIMDSQSPLGQSVRRANSKLFNRRTTQS